MSYLLSLNSNSMQLKYNRQPSLGKSLFKTLIKLLFIIIILIVAILVEKNKLSKSRKKFNIDITNEIKKTFKYLISLFIF